MQGANIGFCESCMKRVPASHVIRDGRVYLCKDCPRCGRTEALVSSDAAAWQAKRDLWGPVAEAEGTCAMHCDKCGQDHRPTLVFVDVTNRCNMNCPICIANISSMGFDFHPPMEYFDRVFRYLSQFDPKPLVELFGGEPTVRADLIDIVRLGRSYRLKPRVVTNGLRLADEAYCQALCNAGARVRLALDGRTPEIYDRLRHNPSVCEKKLKALANLRKYSRRRHSLLCCAAKGINDQAIGDLIDCAHENTDVVNALALLPLAETWTPGTYEGSPATTPEDAERMVQASLPGDHVEFVPAGLLHHMWRVRSFLRQTGRFDRLMFGGVHPNCESMTLLVSDGQRYRGLEHYFRLPFKRMAEEALAVSRRVDGRLARLDPQKPLQRLHGQLIVATAFLPMVRRALDLKRLFRGRPVVNLLRMVAKLPFRGKTRGFFHRYLDAPRILVVMILPFEEPKTIEAARLRNCKAAFAYEDVETGAIKTVPACIWGLYRKELLGRIAAKYGTPAAAAGAPVFPVTPTLRNARLRNPELRTAD